MKVLVTGCTGFTGSHTAATLTAAGHRVRVMVRDRAQVRPVLEPHGVVPDEVAAADMTDRDAVDSALTGCDGVIHTAAVVDLRRGMPSIVHVSSLAVFFTPRCPPMSSALPVVDGTTACARSKVAAEHFARRLQHDGAPAGHLTAAQVGRTLGRRGTPHEIRVPDASHHASQGPDSTVGAGGHRHRPGRDGPMRGDTRLRHDRGPGALRRPGHPCRADRSALLPFHGGAGVSGRGDPPHPHQLLRHPSAVAAPCRSGQGAVDRRLDERRADHGDVRCRLGRRGIRGSRRPVPQARTARRRVSRRDRRVVDQRAPAIRRRVRHLREYRVRTETCTEAVHPDLDRR
ncbi:hypothetical protein MVAC_14883 [Mycolicibacterium vaccae ATCC 25954]|uniref:NAD-dependent epimerase/dehydratase domain-containing protein n=1 Tax=Mycolicibacterium vaccae ATCC 25954 TaxID=1194972 RepID=K0UP77_MYCVA|nr:hypothetical protein MVAC_14883 [Mycolicibacterium vaccae ATCC 25954]